MNIIKQKMEKDFKLCAKLETGEKECVSERGLFGSDFNSLNDSGGNYDKNNSRDKSSNDNITAEENNTLINQNDEKRKRDLTIISTLLQSYKNKNGEYPVSPSLTKLNQNNNEVVNKIRSVSPIAIPIDPKSGYYYSYTSADGKSFELTAQLENLSDPDCDQDLKIKKNICIYS